MGKVWDTGSLSDFAFPFRSTFGYGNRDDFGRQKGCHCNLDDNKLFTLGQHIYICRDSGNIDIVTETSMKSFPYSKICRKKSNSKIFKNKTEDARAGSVEEGQAINSMQRNWRKSPFLCKGVVKFA